MPLTCLDACTVILFSHWREHAIPSIGTCCFNSQQFTFFTLLQIFQFLLFSSLLLLSLLNFYLADNFVQTCAVFLLFHPLWSNHHGRNHRLKNLAPVLQPVFCAFELTRLRADYSKSFGVGFGVCCSLAGGMSTHQCGHLKLILISKCRNRKRLVLTTATERGNEKVKVVLSSFYFFLLTTRRLSLSHRRRQLHLFPTIFLLFDFFWYYF